MQPVNILTAIQSLAMLNSRVQVLPAVRSFRTAIQHTTVLFTLRTINN